MAPRLLIAAVVLLALLMVVYGIGVGVFLRRGSKALDERRAEVTSQWRRFGAQAEAEQQRWAAHPLFQAVDGGNAGKQLNLHVRWSGGIVPPAEVHGDVLPEAVALAMADAGTDWPQSTFDVSAIDLSWMSSLASAGHWDLEAAPSPLLVRRFDPMNELLPEFRDVQNLARVRLLQGLARGELEPALEDVRQLARLCLTTERLIGDMVAVALLRIERQAAEEASRRGLSLEGFAVLSEDDVGSLKRALWASPQWTALLLPEPPPEGPAMSPGFPFIGRCTALYELVFALYVRQFAGAAMPARYQTLTAELERSQCRLTRLRAAWKSGEGELPATGQAFCLADSGGTRPDCSVPDVVTQLPFMRQAFGQMLVSTVSYDWLKFYAKQAEAP